MVGNQAGVISALTLLSPVNVRRRASPSDYLLPDYHWYIPVWRIESGWSQLLHFTGKSFSERKPSKVFIYQWFVLNIFGAHPRLKMHSFANFTANPSSHDGVWREGGHIKTPPSPQQKASKIQINIKTVLCVSKIRWTPLFSPLFAWIIQGRWLNYGSSVQFEERVHVPPGAIAWL